MNGYVITAAFATYDMVAKWRAKMLLPIGLADMVANLETETIGLNFSFYKPQ
jgi:hypothetical protein